MPAIHPAYQEQMAKSALLRADENDAANWSALAAQYPEEHCFFAMEVNET